MVSRGQDFSVTAAFWNELQRMVKWFKGHENSLLQVAEELKRVYPPTTVWVKNASLVRRAAFEILTVSDIIADIRTYEGEKYRPIHFHGITPTSDPLYSICVLQEPATIDGGFARAVISGVTLVKLNITHAQDKYCDVVDGVANSLKTLCVGRARVLLKNIGTGGDNKWGIIRLGDRSGEVLVKNTTGSPINAGFAGTAAVWSGTTGSETATGQTIEVFNRTDLDWEDQCFGVIDILNGYGPYVSPIQREPS
jgi:hypothetical protein